MSRRLISNKCLDLTQILNYSLIVEVGGNIGLDSKEYIRLYNSSLIIFEPLMPLYKRLIRKFGNRSRTKIYPYGLGSYARQLKIEMAGRNADATSIFKTIAINQTKTSYFKTIKILSTVDVIRNILVKWKTKIDLLTINCEGCEYEIIPSLIENSLMTKIKNLQFATHIGLLKNEDQCIYCVVQQKLHITHKLTYQYKALWESWTIKKHILS
ncbi:unnamed protein product [Didymodactylos carnosus]|uniref:Methyltransferase FkbM domain-containing protein n=1 Tax=Didymodactylos carnosus TaxID=1234261 RepID=A0A814QK64_9BILA|nr:unnamed protein product [Didymodactylos carnosus]CAF1119562.1 unnamed protein product [Didymodactylos carnosus]CAF3539044.1 unnamed protein product [Didymodactylos carnosus]CAF3883205.1 unnamed protein product [Didymodactylos carnosus]